MRLIAHRQLTGQYGTVTIGQEFECPDDIARELLNSGVVHKAEPPKVSYETKVIERVPEVGPAAPFRNVPVPDPQPKELVANSNRVLPAADVPPEGDARFGRRRGRSGSHSR